MTEIYTIAGGDWLRQCLNAVAAFMQTGAWAWMRNLAVALSTLFVVYLWIVHHDVMKIVGWIFTLLFVSVLFMRKPVQIIDLTDQAAVYQVDNVPVGIVLPASLITRLGHRFTLGYELVFSQPDVATYSQTGMLFGASLMSKSTDFLSQNPEYTNLFSDYVQNCVLGDIFLNQKYTLEALMQSSDPYTLIFSQPSPLRGVFTSAGVFQTCAEAAVPLKNMLALDNQTGGKTYSYYARQLFAGKPNPDALFGVLLGNTYSYFQQNAQTASEILKQNVVMNGIRQGFLSNASRSGDTASMLNIATTTSLEKQRLAQASTGQIILRSLPILQVVLMGILIGIFPIIVMLGMINLGVAAGKTYVFAWVWLMTWPLLYAILNSAMTFYAQKNGVPVVLSNLSQVQLKYSDIATTAGWLSTMIPFLSLGIATGLGKAFSSVSSSLGSSMLSSSSQASSSVVDANYAYNNMQTDNVQGNSWNTNSTTSFGQMSQQTGSGGTQTRTRDGSTVWDSGGAMSKLPVDISTSRQISSASQQMSRETESQAQTAMSGYNSNVTSTWNTLSQFGSQSGNSDSLTRGADSSVGSNRTRSASLMASAIDTYAKANNISKEKANSVLLSNAVGNTAGTEKRGGVRGSFGANIPGTKIGGALEGYMGSSSRSDTTNTDTESTSGSSRSSQDARHDQSAQAMADYKRGFDELTSAKTSQSGSHTDNNADSRVDQLSASLSGAKSSYQQYSDAHTRSHEYAEMASRTENMSGQSSESLNQQFANFVAERSPENAEQILTNTGSPEVAAQRDQLVRAFVSENVTPKVDADYSNNRQVLGMGMDNVSGGGNAATVSDDYAGNQAQIEERTQGAGIRSDVSQGVNKMVEQTEGKVAENSAVIDAQQQHVEGQRQSLQENHAAQSTQHDNAYAQGTEKQKEYREKGVSITPENEGGKDDKANNYINEKYGISNKKEKK